MLGKVCCFSSLHLKTQETTGLFPKGIYQQQVNLIIINTVIKNDVCANAALFKDDDVGFMLQI